MTKSLLLEIGLEELPAQYVRTSSDQLATRVEFRSSRRRPAASR